MLTTRRKMSSLTLSQKSSISGQLNRRADGSPYLDLCPPTPQWNRSPSLGISSPDASPVYDNDSQAQIAWDAYYRCSRRMNSACVANRAQSVDEQLYWWEETSSICRNAILLHSLTLDRQYDLETAKHLEALECSDLIVQKMVENLSSLIVMPVEELPISGAPSRSMSTSPTLISEEPETVKRSKRHGFSTKIGRFFGHLTAREPMMEVQRLAKPDSILY